MPKIARLTLATGLALILLLTLLAAGLTALLATEGGTRWILGQAVERLGADVRWAQLRGSLLSRLEVSGLEVEQEAFHLVAERAVIAWRPGALLGGEIEVRALGLDDGVLSLRESDDGAASTEALNPADLRLPVNVSLDGVALNGLTVLMPGQTEQTIDSLVLSASLTGDQLVLSSLELRLPQGDVSLSGAVTLRTEMPVELTLSANALLPATTAPGAASTPRRLSGGLALDGSIDWREGIAAALNYRMDVQGAADLVPDLPDRVAAAGRLRGQQRGDSLQIDTLSLRLQEAGLVMTLQGQVSGTDTAEPTVSAELDWEELRWPLAASAPLVRSDAGRISVTGRADDYRLTLDAEVAGADLPRSRWEARVQGDTQSMTVEALRGELLDGWVEASGPIAFAPTPTWDLHIVAGGIDPTPFLPELTAPLEATLSTRGRLDSEGTAVAAVQVDTLRTEAGGFPIEADAALNVQGDLLQIDRLRVRSGSGELGGDGSLSPRDLDLNWTLTITDAASFVPGAKGRIEGDGRLSGSPEAPRLDAALRAAGLAMDTLALDSLDLELAAGLEDDAPLTARLSAIGLSDGDEPVLDRLTIDADGSMADHRLTLDVQAPPARLNAGFEGGLRSADPTWRGQLLSLAGEGDTFGAWDLEAPSTLTAGAEQVRLEQACLGRRSAAGRLCLDGSWQSSGAAALEVDIASVPIEAFLPALTGELSGGLEAAINAGGRLAADGRLELGAGVVRLPDDLEARPLTHGGGHLTLAVDDGGLDAEADFAAPEKGRVDLELRLPALTTLPPAASQPLQGRVSARLPDLAILAALAGPIGRSAGRLSASLDIAGSLDTPLVDGDLRLDDGAVTLPVAGLDLQDIQLRLAHAADNPELLTLTGGLRSGNGRLAAEGFVDPTDGAAQISLRGEGVRAFATPDARVLVSPDLTLQWQQERLQVRGLVTVPRAEITPRLKLGAATTESPAVAGQPDVLVGPSPDVVILGAEPEPEAAGEVTTPLRIDAEVGLVLGRDVTVNAVGLVTRLEGAIGFSLRPEQDDLVPIARGGISLIEGTFRSFGQDLDIETGQVLYSGVPVTEPEIFLRAVRWIDSDPAVSAVGVQLSGPGTAPELELFSRPPLDTAEIQSYLLTGTGTGEYGSRVAIGTQLTERVYVGYGYNLLEETSEFDTLFSITPRFGVGADVGEADSNFNLMFTYEK